MGLHEHPSFPNLDAAEAALAAEDYAMCVDLRPFMDKGTFTVTEDATAARCHRLFRTMGLRHLPVVGSGPPLHGIITRTDLISALEHVTDIDGHEGSDREADQSTTIGESFDV